MSTTVISEDRDLATPWLRFADDIDFLVAYIAPRDVWLVPVKLVTPVVGMCFYPLGCRRGGYYQAYPEAWHLMAPGGDLNRNRQ
jgi:hypothetical protein